MFLFERLDKPLLSKAKFYRRLVNNSMIALIILFISLSIGISGYMVFAHLKFVDSVLNASMILGGMGPVDVLPNDASKYFASAYALFSGVTILSVVGVLFAPLLHRIMHRYHLETDEEEQSEENPDSKKDKDH
ncbi:MAG: hypothetical protein ABI763_09840 [Bacteroidota bacterium]